MQTAGALLTSWPAAARVLCGSWCVASQHAASLFTRRHHSWQPQGTLQHHHTLNPERLLQQHPILQQHAFSTSASSRGSEPRPTPQQDGSKPSEQPQQQDRQQEHDHSSSGSSDAQHQGVNMQQEAKEAAKSMLTKSFDMEELWFAAVGGKLKVWSAKTYPELKVTGRTAAACWQLENLSVLLSMACIEQPELAVVSSLQGHAITCAHCFVQYMC